MMFAHVCSGNKTRTLAFIKHDIYLFYSCVYDGVYAHVCVRVGVANIYNFIIIRYYSYQIDDKRADMSR